MLTRAIIEDIERAYRSVDRRQEDADAAVQLREEARQLLHSRHQAALTAEGRLAQARRELQELVDKYGIGQ